MPVSIIFAKVCFCQHPHDPSTPRNLDADEPDGSQLFLKSFHDLYVSAGNTGCSAYSTTHDTVKPIMYITINATTNNHMINGIKPIAPKTFHTSNDSNIVYKYMRKRFTRRN